MPRTQKSQSLPPSSPPPRPPRTYLVQHSQVGNHHGRPVAVVAPTPPIPPRQIPAATVLQVAPPPSYEAATSSGDPVAEAAPRTNLAAIHLGFSRYLYEIGPVPEGCDDIENVYGMIYQAFGFGNSHVTTRVNPENIAAIKQCMIRMLRRHENNRDQVRVLVNKIDEMEEALEHIALINPHSTIAHDRLAAMQNIAFGYPEADFIVREEVRARESTESRYVNLVAEAMETLHTLSAMRQYIQKPHTQLTPLAMGQFQQNIHKLFSEHETISRGYSMLIQIHESLKKLDNQVQSDPQYPNREVLLQRAIAREKLMGYVQSTYEFHLDRILNQSAIGGEHATS